MYPNFLYHVFRDTMEILRLDYIEVAVRNITGYFVNFQTIC